MRLRRLASAAAGLSLLLAMGCTGGGEKAAPTNPAARTTTASPSPTPVDPVSIQALIQRDHTGSDLRLGTVLARTDAYTSYAVTYESDGLTISGLMNIPRGKGPFPALVLAHGYIDPAVYTTGRGLAREQDLLAREGYVVLHSDYRNHARSDDDPDNNVNLRLGYTSDVIGAVLALRGSGRPEIDPDRIGLLGRSMGGGVVYNTLVVAPGLVDAAVVFAPVSGRPQDNIDRFQRGEGDPIAAEIDAAHGTPEENPEFWRNVSPLTFVHRVTEPLLIHHGTADDTCPLAWSKRTVAAFEAAGKDVELREYPGEGHTFGPQWPRSMVATTAFFERHLR
ncbi:peptidase S9 prolyl oligopeptidase active site domain-containing protein [Streptomyces davaonensis JCM 4913]|uniref:Peptidase S9 prolyl oligopeptidase active site domain-containing protein n=1 Tax=Streptomyces davaonensis (strain DSM 101723 / JCM 4913 / KCC S-0913 / 768) TaxID=1214101 RepID=K4QYE7_STRDJ|nr:prolyl oligopeptidase family serine peptidase [Streptomyces davaonensis]CCK25840.1 peptidase S9 prolyl oligopeptidase active site domain-containing protein [Streptomyces davaonensis JCM 4913]